MSQYYAKNTRYALKKMDRHLSGSNCSLDRCENLRIPTHPCLPTYWVTSLLFLFKTHVSEMLSWSLSASDTVRVMRFFTNVARSLLKDLANICLITYAGLVWTTLPCDQKINMAALETELGYFRLKLDISGVSL